MFYGGNAASVEAGEKYLLGGAVAYVDGELEETKYAIREARELSIEALRNILAAVNIYQFPHILIIQLL